MPFPNICCFIVLDIEIMINLETIIHRCRVIGRRMEKIKLSRADWINGHLYFTS